MQIVKRSASLKDGVCNLIVITDKEVINLSGKYDNEVVDFIDALQTGIFEGFDDDYLIAELESLLNTDKSKKDQEVKSIQKEIEFLEETKSKLDYKVEDIRDTLNRVFNTTDWYLEDDSIRYKKSDILMPELLLEAIAVSQNDLEVKAYGNFWKRLASNPLENVKKRLFDWIVSHGIKISEYGLIIGYRGAVKLSQPTDVPVNELFWKCKNAKKGLSTHGIVKNTKNGEVNYSYRKLSDVLSDGYEWISSKSLLELIDEESETTYTHWYNRSDGVKLEFKLNEVYKDDKKVNTDPSNSYAAGIHFGSVEYGIANFGGTRLGALICPSKVACIPYSDIYKGRASEIYPFIEFTSEESMKEFHKTGKVLETEIDYLKELDKDIEDRLAKLEDFKATKLNFKGEYSNIVDTIQTLEEKANRILLKEIDLEIDILRSIINEKNQ